MAAHFFRSSNGQAIDIAEILAPFLEQKGGKVTTDEMTVEVVSKITAGEIEMDPSAEKLRNMMIMTRVGEWSARATEDGAARFYADRHRGRFDRKTGQVAQIIETERKQYVESIRQSMMVEMPAAYRSQARLWAELDSKLDAVTLADACTTLIVEAINAGVKDARGGEKKEKAA